MFHADNEIVLPIKFLEKHRIFSDIRFCLHFWSLKVSVTADIMPRTPSHISTFLFLPELFQILGPIQCRSLLSKTVTYVSHHLVSVFLRFLSPLQSRFPISHLLLQFVHGNQQHQARRTFICTVYGCISAVSTEKCISLWYSHRMVHILDHTTPLLVRPNL